MQKTMNVLLPVFPGCTFAKVVFKAFAAIPVLKKADTKQSFASFFRRRLSPLVFKPFVPLQRSTGKTGREGPAKVAEVGKTFLKSIHICKQTHRHRIPT